MQFGNRVLDLSRPQIMGILNTTPDSFSDGGHAYTEGHLDLDLALRVAEQMVLDGASILDVGGESTRPGATSVSEQQELDRVAPVVEAICRKLDVIVSVDTSSPLVMQTAVGLGAGCINDVRALRAPDALVDAARLKVPVCLMHMQGDPTTMQHNPQYTNVVSQVSEFFQERLLAAEAAGLSVGDIILDPGIGFGKTDEHNLELLSHLADFVGMGHPVLVGLSRKSMIGRLLGRDIHQRLPGSLGFGLVALQKGARILRVHDVAATADIIKVFELTT